MLSRRSIPNFPVVSFHRSEVNSVPLSVMISCGTPCSLTISFMKRWANCRASRSLEHRMKWLILLSRSITSSMVSYPSYFGRSVMGSIAIDFHGRSGHCLTVAILGCMSEHFCPLRCVAILYESFDIFSYLQPIISLADEFGRFCCSTMSRLWGFVVFSDKRGLYPLVVWYPNLSFVP